MGNLFGKKKKRIKKAGIWNTVSCRSLLIGIQVQKFGYSVANSEQPVSTGIFFPYKSIGKQKQLEADQKQVRRRLNASVKFWWSQTSVMETSPKSIKRGPKTFKISQLFLFSQKVTNNVSIAHTFSWSPSFLLSSLIKMLCWPKNIKAHFQISNTFWETPLCVVFPFTQKKKCHTFIASLEEDYNSNTSYSEQSEGQCQLPFINIQCRSQSSRSVAICWDSVWI